MHNKTIYVALFSTEENTRFSMIETTKLVACQRAFSLLLFTDILLCYDVLCRTAFARDAFSQPSVAGTDRHVTTYNILPWVSKG